MKHFDAFELLSACAEGVFGLNAKGVVEVPCLPVKLMTIYKWQHGSVLGGAI